MTVKSLSLRQAILERVKDLSTEQLTDVIEDSIDSDERALPGLGVLFEIIWKHSDEEVRQKLVASLKDNLLPD